MNAYRKTVAAVLGAAGTWCLASLPDGKITQMEWVALAVALATALGVYTVTNDDRPTDRGLTVIDALVAVFIAILIVVVLVVLLRHV